LATPAAGRCIGFTLNLCPEIRHVQRREQLWFRPITGLDEVTTCDYLACMRVVGIKELKARLSEYLREVRRGEVFLVTDRDTVVAELRPAGSDVPPRADGIDEVFDALRRAGEVQPPTTTRTGWKWSPRGAGLDAGTAASLLEELRGERGGPDA
jgi:antitoxin (DNA-binding transcriptional repressor) of toxin-antitoxin stability system